MVEQTEHLQEFFAVTMTSVYHVTSNEPSHPSAVKIALKGESRAPVGEDLVTGGEILAIAKWLQPFTPEKYGMAHQLTGDETRLEMVNTGYWGKNSSPIVALFKTETEAMDCFNSEALEQCDPRWFESTKSVLATIGDNHPSFSVCHFESLSLLPVG